MEATLSFQPNRLVIETGHRLVIEHFSRIPGHRLVLRPARKRLFIKDPEISSLFVELNKPAFAALVRNDDPLARPVLVFETDSISSGIRDLYRNYEIPFVEADQTAGRGMFRFERPGFAAKLTFDDRGADQAVESILRWSETMPSQGKGNLVRNEIEDVISRTLNELSGEFGTVVNYHIPFGYAAGYRPDLPRVTARHTIEAVVSISPEVDAEAPVILPIRIETAQEVDREEEDVERDQLVAEFVCNVGMPMVAIQQSGQEEFQVTYSMDEGDESLINLKDESKWNEVLKKILSNALETTGRLATK